MSKDAKARHPKNIGAEFNKGDVHHEHPQSQPEGQHADEPPESEPNSQAAREHGQHPAPGSVADELAEAFKLEQAFASLEASIKGGSPGNSFTAPPIKGLKLWHHKCSATVTVVIES